MGETGSPLDRLHRLLGAVYGAMRFDPGHTDTATSAAEAFALKHGVCQDLSHIFIAAARSLGSPARYVSGHLARSGGEIDQQAAHAWAEAYVPDLGWIGFDPANGRLPHGLLYPGGHRAGLPGRGARARHPLRRGGGEQLDVKLRVTSAGQ